jgi:alpha-ketoglutarate-dependent taurine dioxygenase
VTTFEVRDLDAPCGAEVLGFDPRVAVDDASIPQLRHAIDERGVVVFRDIELDWVSQQHLTELLVSTAPPSEIARYDGDPWISYVSNRVEGALIPYGRLLWHSDTMWSDRPEDAISLYGLEVEPEVAPTFYASATRGWDTLPADLRRRVEDLQALHGEGQQQHAVADPTLFLYNHEHHRSVTTPVALRHPRTGRTMLYVSEMQTRSLVGVSPDESEALLAALRAHLYRPANTYEHHWRQGDLVVWDNLAIQHTRPYVALDGPARTLRKVAAPPPWVRPDLPPLPAMVAVQT